ncbi:MAG: IS21 family transposase [Desulfitobacteriaceae bacterium]|nr:IS21 family transposase [Desulfitobacteriaceae bacterium]
MKQKQRIILKHLEGMSNRSIARELHMSKDTVNKYVVEYEKQKSELLLINPEADQQELIQAIVEKPKYNSDNREPKRVTPEMIKAIDECLELNEWRRANGMSKQQMKKIDIYEYLVNKKNFNISYSTVKRLVKSIEDRHREAFIRQEYDYGDVCEFDWGTVKLDIGSSGYEAYQMAVFSSAKGGYRYAMLFKAQDTPAFQQSHAEFFDHCKGNFKMMVYDNMRVAVKKFVGLHEKEPTKALTELSIYYGFNFRFTNIYRGNEKGHVERSVEYVRRRVFSEPGCDSFYTLADANQFLAMGCMRLNSQPMSNGNIPLEVFQEEQKHLLPHLPKFESCLYSENRVDKYSTIMVSQNHYSVPDTLVGKMVSIKTFTNKIIVYHDNSIVAVHERSYKLHDWKIDIHHYLRTLHKKPGALHGSTALLQADTHIKYLYEHYYSGDAKTFLQVLEIIYEKGTDVVTEALKKLELLSPMDMSADKVRVICEHNQEKKNSIKVSYTDHLTEKSRNTLSAYDRLAALQSGKLKKEAV